MVLELVSVNETAIKGRCRCGDERTAAAVLLTFGASAAGSSTAAALVESDDDDEDDQPPKKRQRFDDDDNDGKEGALNRDRVQSKGKGKQRATDWWKHGSQ